MRVNTILEDGSVPEQVKNEYDLTWEELIEQGARALDEHGVTGE